MESSNSVGKDASFPPLEELIMSVVYHGDPLITPCGVIIQSGNHLLVDFSAEPREGDMAYLCLETGESIIVQLTGIGESSIRYRLIPKYFSGHSIAKKEIAVWGKIVMNINGELYAAEGQKTGDTGQETGDMGQGI